MRFVSVRAAAAAALAALSMGAVSVRGAVALPAFNVDPAQITVSGLSSGGYFASQLGFAYSATFKGVGVFAAGPYPCAGHSHYTACMYNATIGAGMLSAMRADIDRWSGSAIDARANVAAQRIYLFVGASDFTVGPNPMSALATQYANNGVPAGNREHVVRSGTAHVFPTDFDSPGNNACGTSASPYIANCGYDGAKAALTRFYGALAPRNDAPPASNYLEFDQTPFTAGSPGMAATGWLYVPARCAAGSTCRLHVALHGCQQNTATIGDRFVKGTGYTRWADTNDIIVLFPQTRVDNTARPTAASGSLANPNGCWDWVGWSGSGFAQRAGTQMAAVKAMVDRLAGGGAGAPPATLPPPAGVATSGATASSMVVAWAAVDGASGYNVYRNGARANAAQVGSTSFTDTGLAPGTTYAWTVSALDAANAESAPSAPATGTTTGTPAACFTSSNYAHTTAGRAHASGGYALANGSNQNMGLWNVFVATTLKQTGPDFYVIGSCP